MRFYREVNVTMELASAGLEKIEGRVTIAPVKFLGLCDRVVVHIKINGQTRSPTRSFFQEDGKSPRKSIRKILIHIRAIGTLGRRTGDGLLNDSEWLPRRKVLLHGKPSQMGKLAVRVPLVDSRSNIVRHGFEFVVFLRSVDKLQRRFDKFLGPTVLGLGSFINQTTIRRGLPAIHFVCLVVGYYSDSVPV